MNGDRFHTSYPQPASFSMIPFFWGGRRLENLPVGAKEIQVPGLAGRACDTHV
jgi:hypothetical protein